MKSIPGGDLSSKVGVLIAATEAISNKTKTIWEERTRIRNVLNALKQKLQRELNQPGIGPGRRGSDHAEVGVIRSAAGCVRRSKLRAVKQIKDLGTEFETEAFVRIQQDSLEHRKVEVIHPVGAKRWIDSRFTSESKVRWRRKTGRIKPIAQSRYAAAGS